MRNVMKVHRGRSRLLLGVSPLEMVNRRCNVRHVRHRSLDLLVVTTLGGDAVVATLGSQQVVSRSWGHVPRRERGMGYWNTIVVAMVEW